jgi:cytoskeleton-associated protein 5
MFHLPGVPTPLYTNLFSMNQQNNIKAIRYIRQKLNKASELSDILIKWAFSIGWFRESVQLQSEILQFLNFLLFQLRQENYEIHVTETRIIKGYLHMLVYMICKCN